MIKIVNLTKKYGKKTAVDSLCLNVKKGELFALLGVNGAGKTTTVRILSCLSKSTDGEAFVGGFSCATESEKVKSIIGISPQDTAVAGNLTVRENLEFIARIYGVEKSNVDKMTELFRMHEVENTRAKTLSGGWQRKLSIAMALISEPEVLFLDEPTLGLDVLTRRELWKMIESLKNRVTIILTTHHMEEAENLADRIAIMVSGKISAVGTLSEIENISGKKGLEESFVEIAERSMK